MKKMAEVPRKNTPISREDAEHALRYAFKNLFGRDPTDDELQMYVAHTWGIETGRGKSSQNNSLGNIIATSKWKGDFWRPHWYSDASHPLHEAMLRGEAPEKFRAYSIVEEAAADYFKTLDKQFPELLVAANMGDTLQFAQAVRDKAYTPGINVENFSNTLKDLMGERDSGLGEIVVVAPPGTGMPKKKSGLGLAGLFGIVGGLGIVALASKKKGKSR